MLGRSEPLTRAPQSGAIGSVEEPSKSSGRHWSDPSTEKVGLSWSVTNTEAPAPGNSGNVAQSVS